MEQLGTPTAMKRLTQAKDSPNFVTYGTNIQEGLRGDFRFPLSSSVRKRAFSGPTNDLATNLKQMKQADFVKGRHDSPQLASHPAPD